MIREAPARAVAIILALSGVTACSAPRPAPRRASATLPTIVSRPAHGRCDARALERSAPWAGKIVERHPSTYVEDSSRTVRTEWALCGDLDEKACSRWALKMGEARASASGLVVEVLPGRSDRGKVWILKIDGAEEAHLFPTNKDFVSYFRGLAAEGKKLEIISSDHVVETRYGRVEIAYKTPLASLSRPAARWKLEIEAEPQAAAETILAFEDLEAQGIDMGYESWDDLNQVARTLSGHYTIPELSATRTPATARPIELWLDVHCAE